MWREWGERVCVRVSATSNCCAAEGSATYVGHVCVCVGGGGGWLGHQSELLRATYIVRLLLLCNER